MKKKTKKFSIKGVDEEKGEVTAVIATLNVVDHDKDVTEPGAFGTQEAPILPTHTWSSVPLGKAHISEVKNEAIAQMKFNLDIPAAADWFRALKFDIDQGPPLQEYSY